MNLPTSRDKLLFTPGPLTTSLSVKQAMLHDAGSWHWEFNELVGLLRDRILALAGVSRESGFEAILLQGSGTYGVESVFASAVPEQGRVLILANGAYGERMIAMCQHLKVAHTVLRNLVRSRGRSLRLEARLASERQGEAPASSVDFTALGEGLVALAEDDQEILRLVYWEGLSLREVGAVLDCTEKAAGIRVSRARSRLREVMAERVTSASEGQ